MSEVKRYSVTESYGLGDMREEPQGEYVRYEDYARLKAEVERLKAETIKQIETAMPPIEDYIAKLEAQVERLKAEPDALTAYLYADTLRRDDIKTLKAHIERLTKAGDAMANNIPRMVTCQVDANEAINLRDAWNAAKEGKQS